MVRRRCTSIWFESAGVEFINGSIVRSGREVEKSRSRIEQLSPENDLVKDDAVCGVALDDAPFFGKSGN
jgi:hypothetical protein